MTLFRSLIRAASNLEYFEHTENVNSPHSTAERLKRAVSLTNNYIAETHGESGMFATLFFGILDPRDGTLTYINGGHEPPIIIRLGNERESLLKTGPAVGAITNACFDILETRLDMGDIFFAFTDGAPEAKDPHDEFFGRERLLDILQRDSGSSHELIKILETELHQYIDSATQFDDITLLAVRRV
jgi:sigma-B regulation protein RsbU (phosphoserine phosphatase)